MHRIAESIPRIAVKLKANFFAHQVAQLTIPGDVLIDGEADLGFVPGPAGFGAELFNAGRHRRRRFPLDEAVADGAGHALAAEQLINRPAERFAFDVPTGEIDSGHGVDGGAVGLKHALMQAFDVEGIGAKQCRAQAVVKMMLDRFDRVAAPSAARDRLADAGDAVVRFDLHDNGIGRGGDPVSGGQVAAAVDVDDGAGDIRDFHFLLRRAIQPLPQPLPEASGRGEPSEDK